MVMLVLMGMGMMGVVMGMLGMGRGKKWYTGSNNRLFRVCRGILALVSREGVGCGRRRRRRGLVLLLRAKKMMVLRLMFSSMSVRLM